ncbi:VOC family protein [Gymnodinialimonas sp. 57CJ19]|uniref:bleomycin resistance protein n=1 Tax=Gymnodinialimonas sp. 57CJ19 TaxID=3138498 RepID=UPI0031345C25
MRATPGVSGTSPIVPVSDLTTSLAFYTQRLGFTHEVGKADDGYGLVRRGALMVAFVNAADEAALAATANNISAQMWVDDLDGYWTEIAPRLADLPEGRVRAPFDQSYGTREFHIKDPDGFLMLFTQMQGGAS